MNLLRYTLIILIMIALGCGCYLPSKEGSEREGGVKDNVREDPKIIPKAELGIDLNLIRSLKSQINDLLKSTPKCAENPQHPNCQKVEISARDDSFNWNF